MAVSTLYVNQLFPKDAAYITYGKKCAFRAYSDFSGTRPGIVTGWETNGTTKGSFDDTNGAFNNSSGTFTAPVSGIYFLSVKYTPVTGDNYRALLKLFKNGQAWDELIDFEPADYFMAHDINHSSIYKMTSGDYFQLQEYNLPSNGNSQFIWTMYLLG